MSELEALLPASVADERGRAFVQVLLERFAMIDLSTLLINRVDSTPANALPALGWQFGLIGAEGWHLADDVDQKRELIRRAVLLQRRRGTPWAVKEALRALGFPAASIQEGQPRLLMDGTTTFDAATTLSGDTRWALFGITVDVGEERGLTGRDRELVRQTVAAWKNARSELSRVAFRATVADSVTVVDALPMRARSPATDPVRWGRGEVALLDGTRSFNQGTRTICDGSIRADATARLTGHRGSPGSMGAERATLLMRARSRVRERVSAAVAMDGRSACDGVLSCGDNPGCYELIAVRSVRRTRLDGRLTMNGSRANEARMDGRAVCDGSVVMEAPARLSGTRRMLLAS